MSFSTLFLLLLHVCLLGLMESFDADNFVIETKDNTFSALQETLLSEESEAYFVSLLANDGGVSTQLMGALSLEIVETTHEIGGFSFDMYVSANKISRPIVVPVFIGSYWCPAGESEFSVEAIELQTILRDITASWDIMFYLFNFKFMQPGFTIASHCITSSNSSYTQAGIERYLNDWTTNSILPGLMQKNYIYVLLFPPDVPITLSSGSASCSSSTSPTWCAYHSYSHYSPGVGYNRYIALPYLGNTSSSTGSCFSDCHFSDSEANYAYIYTVELQNTMTNPDLNSFSTSGSEAGNVCSGVMRVEVASPPRPYNANYLGAQFWSTTKGNCAGTVKSYYVPPMYDSYIHYCNVYEQSPEQVAHLDLLY